MRSVERRGLPFDDGTINHYYLNHSFALLFSQLAMDFLQHTFIQKQRGWEMNLMVLRLTGLRVNFERHYWYFVFSGNHFCLCLLFLLLTFFLFYLFCSIVIFDFFGFGVGFGFVPDFCERAGIVFLYFFIAVVLLERISFYWRNGD